MPKWNERARRFTVKTYFSHTNGSWHCTIPRPIASLLEIKDRITFVINSEKGVVEVVAGELEKERTKPTFSQLIAQAQAA